MCRSVHSVLRIGRFSPFNVRDCRIAIYQCIHPRPECCYVIMYRFVAHTHVTAIPNIITKLIVEVGCIFRKENRIFVLCLFITSIVVVNVAVDVG